MSNEQIQQAQPMTTAEAATLAAETALGVRKIADELQNTFPDAEEAHRATERLRDAAVYLENFAHRLNSPAT